MYLNASINQSPTISEKAGAAMTTPGGLAVVYDGSGDIVLAGDGVYCVGILPIDTAEAVAIGDTLSPIVKDITLWKSGAAFAKGAELAADANAKAIAAVTGKYVVAHALQAATAANQIIQVQIVKAGKK